MIKTSLKKLQFISALIILCLISPRLVFAQKIIKGTIIDSYTGQTIPYASITVKKESSISWKDGSFLFELENFNAEDSLFVQCLGFETFKTSLKDYSKNNDKEIRLTPKVFSLNEVIVSAHKTKRTKIKTFGVYKRKPSDGWATAKYKEQIALYISNEKRENGIIQNLKFYIKKSGTPNKEFRVHLYALDQTKNNPGMELLPEAIYASGTTGNEWIIIDVSKYQIKYPPEGFFIAFEALPDSPNDTYITYKKMKFKSPPKNVEFGATYEKPKDNLTWHFTKFSNDTNYKWRRTRKPAKDEIYIHPMMAADILIYK